MLVRLCIHTHIYNFSSHTRFYIILKPSEKLTISRNMKLKSKNLQKRNNTKQKKYIFRSVVKLIGSHLFIEHILTIKNQSERYYKFRGFFFFKVRIILLCR